MAAGIGTRGTCWRRLTELKISRQYREARRVRRTRWHRWFAWFPVHVTEREMRWLEFVERKYTQQPDGSYWWYREVDGR